MTTSSPPVEPVEEVPLPRHMRGHLFSSEARSHRTKGTAALFLTVMAAGYGFLAGATGASYLALVVAATLTLALGFVSLVSIRAARTAEHQWRERRARAQAYMDGIHPDTPITYAVMYQLGSYNSLTRRATPGTVVLVVTALSAGHTVTVRTTPATVAAAPLPPPMTPRVLSAAQPAADPRPAPTVIDGMSECRTEAEPTPTPAVAQQG